MFESNWSHAKHDEGDGKICVNGEVHSAALRLLLWAQQKARWSMTTLAIMAIGILGSDILGGRPIPAAISALVSYVWLRDAIDSWRGVKKAKQALLLHMEFMEDK